jgi:hypothetical protein
LREEIRKNEFFKDATAIINSYGGDDGFIIFGVDEKTKELCDASLDQSGYKKIFSVR